MNKSESLTRQIREFRHAGLQVTLRAGNLRIQDPSGTVFEERPQDSDCPVELFLSHAFQRYAFSVLASDCPVIATGSQEAKWTIGDITLQAQAGWAVNFGVELTATTVDGLATTREIWDSNRWPEPEELATLRDCLIEDARLLSRLRVYLHHHKTKFEYTHGGYSPGAIDISFQNGKISVSCIVETDFCKLRRALDVLDGFWSCPAKSLETAPLEEPLETHGLDLV